MEDKYKEFLGEMILEIGRVVHIPIGTQAEEFIKDFIRQAVKEKLAYMKQ